MRKNLCNCLRGVDNKKIKSFPVVDHALFGTEDGKSSWVCHGMSESLDYGKIKEAIEKIYNEDEKNKRHNKTLELVTLNLTGIEKTIA